MSSDEHPDADRLSSHPHRRRSDVPDAVTLLTADHRAVLDLFTGYARLVAHQAAATERADLLWRLCTELEVHMQLEEELFYPMCRLHLRDPAPLDEAVAEHASARALILRLRASQPENAGFDSQVRLLGETVARHVHEEEAQLFPRARRWIEVDAMGETLHARRPRLLELARRTARHATF